jgi:hypothetical protein
MARIVEVEMSRLTASGGLPPKTAATAPPATPAPEFPTPSAGRPIFRELQAGEQRVEGLLERIECPAGRPVFHLKTPTLALTFTATQLPAVDLISYRSDVTGSVTCGPFKEPLAVYVTWRPASDGSGARVAIAIEILPKAPAGSP